MPRERGRIRAPPRRATAPRSLRCPRSPRLDVLAPPTFRFSLTRRSSDRISPVTGAGEVTVLGLGALPGARQWCRRRSVGRTQGSVNGAYPRLGPGERAIGGQAASVAAPRTDGPAHAAPDDFHHLFGVGLGLAALDRLSPGSRRRDPPSAAAKRHRPPHAARPSAAGCRCNTPRARSCARCRAPGPPCAPAGAAAGRGPWCSCDEMGGPRR
jgi:hypothetical protein